MSRVVRVACCFGVVVAVLAPRVYGQATPAVLEYLGERAARLAEQLPPVPSTVDAWEQQRAATLQRLTARLGLPVREPMRAAVNDSRATGDLVIEQVAYLWAERVYALAATVIRSKQATGRQPAIVVPSGAMGYWEFRSHRPFVEQLARQGFVVLCCDDPRIGLRQSPPAGLYVAASAAGLPVTGIQVFDALRGLDYLLTRADVDPGKIGTAGLGAGALQAHLAAALEPRFQFLVSIGGAMTSEGLLKAAVLDATSQEPSAFVAGLPAFTDWGWVAACVAPRPVLPVSAKSDKGMAAASRKALKPLQAVYGLYHAERQIQAISGEAVDDLTPWIPEASRWLAAQVLPALKSSDAVPTACGQPENPDFNLLGYLQRRSEAQAARTSTPLTAAQREELVRWLRQACALDTLKAAADQPGKVSEGDGWTSAQLALGVDAGQFCPAVLVRPAASATGKRPAVVLSHDDRQSAASPRIAESARQLAAAGYVVLIPEHASVDPQSRQTLANPEQPSFYGDEAASLVGLADATGLSPLALRVIENMAAFRSLAAQPEVDAAKIVFAGIGVGSVDAALAALLEPRTAGVAALDATTLRDWVANVAPSFRRFYHIVPHLPSLLTQADLDTCYAALAPKPLLLVRLKDGWSRSGFEQVAATATTGYQAQQAARSLTVCDARGVIERADAGKTEGVDQQLLAVARTLVPTPPQGGVVGNSEGVQQRRTTDSAAGLVWLAAELDGSEQEFTGEGYQLQTWSWFNGKGPAQQGFAITPLILKRVSDGYELTGIGRTRINTGAGAQTFAFEPVAGTAVVGEGYFFGWHDGSAEGKSNAGVVEFEEGPDSRMIILTGNGQMDGQKLKLGASYRPQAEYRRRYSIMAVSKKP